MNTALAMERFGGLLDWIARNSAQASLLILIVFLVQGIFRKILPARWNYALGLLVLIRLLLPAVPSSPWSASSVARAASPAPIAAVEFAAPSAPPPGAALV